MKLKLNGLLTNYNNLPVIRDNRGIGLYINRPIMLDNEPNYCLEKYCG